MQKIVRLLAFTVFTFSSGIWADVVLVPSGTTVTETVIHDSNELGIIECRGEVEVKEGEFIIGAETLGGPLLNCGSISVVADNTMPSFAFASGMFRGDDNGVLTNCGTISVVANITSTVNGGGSPGSEANGMNQEVLFAMGQVDSGVLTNCGTISAMSTNTVTVKGGIAGYSVDPNAFAYGIFHGGNFGVLTNCGAISTTANMVLMLDASTTVSGIFAVSRCQAAPNGMAHGGDNGVLINYGTISAVATAATTVDISDEKLSAQATASLEGMEHNGDSGVVTNYGTISAMGTAVTTAKGDTNANATVFAKGMSYNGGFGVLTNCGSISTVANTVVTAEDPKEVPFSFVSAIGMDYVGSIGFGVLTNCGTISTLATASVVAVTVDVSSNVLAYGMHYRSDSGVLTNCGRISAAATIGGGTLFSAYGMYYEGASGTITNCGMVSAVVQRSAGSGIAEAIHIEGIHNTLNLLSGSRLVGDVFVEADTILNVGRNLNLALTTSNAKPVLGAIANPYIGDGFNDPLFVFDTTGLALQPDVVVDLADAVLDGISSGYSFCAPQRCGFWAEGLGSYRKRSDKVGYHNEQAGFLAGYSRRVCNGVAGVFGGVIASWAAVDGHTQEAELSTPFLGLSYERVYDCFSFGVAVAGGQSSWENDRYVENNKTAKGVERAHSEPDGAFFTAQAHVSRYFPCLLGAPTLYGDLRYAGIFLDDYRENGSTANFAVKERDIGVVTARIVVEPTLQGPDSCWMLSPFVGLVGRHQTQGDEVKGALNNVPLSFSQDSSNSIGGLFGVRASGIVRALDWFVRLEGTVDGANGSRLLAHLGVGHSF
jgi:hypothetical protein